MAGIQPLANISREPQYHSALNVPVGESGTNGPKALWLCWQFLSGSCRLLRDKADS